MKSNRLFITDLNTKNTHMKSLKINKIILLLIGFVVFNSCVQDDDFDTPNLSFVEPNIAENQIKSLSALAGDLAQEQSGFDTEPLDYSNEQDTVSYIFSDTDQYITGYVVSSDEAGNYFEELIIQDKPENPTIGIKLLLDVNPLFTKYEVGRKVYVKLNGLSVGITNSVLTLGVLNGSEVDKIPSSFETQFVQRSNEVATIVPLPISITDLTEDALGKTNMMVQLTDVQFNRNEVIAADSNLITYASSSSDLFDGERTLESCTTSGSVIFSTSTFADFKGLALPTGRGTVNAILSRNFEGDRFIVSVNTPEDITFGGIENRCDPIELDCGIATTTGNTNLFNDDFESQSNNALISGNGWTNFIQEGSEGWEAYTQTGTNASLGRSARVGSFNSNDASSIAWLITPAIDLDTNSGVTINFKTSNSFSDGSTMELLYSDDWDGTEANIASATWGILPAAYIAQDADFFGAWFDSENVNLSCANGTIHIAFKYVGSGASDFDGTYELDEISIDAQ